MPGILVARHMNRHHNVEPPLSWIPTMIRPLLVAAAVLLSGCTNAVNAQSGASLRAALPSLAPLVKRVVPSVVNIAVTESVGSDGDAQLPQALRGTPLEKQFRDRLRSRREQVQGAGSGFVIDASGIIVTNNHVVGHADRIIVSLSNGTELMAKVIGTDELTDIAVIKVDGAPSLPAVTWGDSRTVEVGDWIVAAGNPFGLGSSVSAGDRLGARPRHRRRSVRRLPADRRADQSG